jgi:hypothetical protein
MAESIFKLASRTVRFTPMDKSPFYCFERRLCATLEPVWTLDLLTLLWIQPRLHCQRVTIPTELSYSHMLMCTSQLLHERQGSSLSSLGKVIRARFVHDHRPINNCLLGFVGELEWRRALSERGERLHWMKYKNCWNELYNLQRRSNKETVSGSIETPNKRTSLGGPCRAA